MERNELMVTARLALLDVSGEEMARLKAEVDRMLNYFSQMKDLKIDDLSGVGAFDPPRGANRLREDSVCPADTGESAETLLANAPEREERFISIPNVL